MSPISCHPHWGPWTQTAPCWVLGIARLVLWPHGVHTAGGDSEQRWGCIYQHGGMIQREVWPTLSHQCSCLTRSGFRAKPAFLPFPYWLLWVGHLHYQRPGTAGLSGFCHPDLTHFIIKPDPVTWGLSIYMWVTANVEYIHFCLHYRFEKMN